MVRKSDDLVETLLRRQDSQAESGSGVGGDGAMTGRILTFRPGRDDARRGAESSADVADLPDERNKRMKARTVSGVFVYSARL